MKKSLLCFTVILILSCVVTLNLKSVAQEVQPQGWDSIENILSGSSGESVLTIGGKLNGGRAFAFSLNDITRLPSSTISVTHQISGKKDTYTGVLLHELLEKLKVESGATYLIIVASNDYKVAVRLDDIQRYEYLLTYRKNGVLYRELPPEQNKGPLAITINFDKYPELDYDIYKHQLVWFVEKINVK